MSELFGNHIVGFPTRRLILHDLSVVRKEMRTFPGENQQTDIPTRSDSDLTVQSQKQARSLKFRNLRRKGIFCVVKTKTLIGCAVTDVTVQLICAFVFAYACCWFSYVMDQFCILFHDMHIFKN